MAIITNPFDSTGFSVVELTKAFNELPPPFVGKIAALNLMPAIGITTQTVVIEESEFFPGVLSARPVDAPPQVSSAGTRRMRSFVVPHFASTRLIMPSEIAGVRAFGSEATDVVTDVVVRKLTELRMEHSLTLEYLRSTALQGIIKDGSGSTICDLYSEFGVTQQIIDFALDVDTTTVFAKCSAVKKHIDNNIYGGAVTSYRCLCSRSFFDALISHPNVKEHYVGRSDVVSLPGVGDTFTFAGITFDVYGGSYIDKTTGLAQPFLPDNVGFCFPEGVSGLFATFFAPANFNETVGTLGLEVYAKQQERSFGRGFELYAESNPLPMCFRPQAIVKVTV